MPDRASSLGYSTGELLGLLLGKRAGTGATNAKNQRAQEILNQLLKAKGMPTPTESPKEEPGVMRKIGHAIDPARVGEWLTNLGPIPQGIDNPDQALSSIASTGVDQATLLAMARQISDIKNRSAYDAASSMYERTGGLESGTIQDAGPEGLNALSKAMPRGQGSNIRVFPITDQRTGLTTLNAVNLDALDLNSLAAGEAVPIPNSTGVNRNAPPSSSTNIDIDPVTGKVSGIGTTIGGIQDAANAGERFKTISREKRQERLGNMDITLSGILYDADRLAKAYEKGGPGGLPGVLATAFDSTLNSGQRLLKLSGVSIPLLDAVERDPTTKELIGLASLRGRQKVAAYNLAVGIAGLQERSASGLSAKELAQIMDTLAPVFGGSPQAAIATIQEVVQGAAKKRNILAESLDQGPYEAYDDQQYLMQNPEETPPPEADAATLPQATEEDINKAKKRERHNKTTGAWETF